MHTNEAINSAARKVAASAIQSVPPLKVPLAESTGGIKLRAPRSPVTKGAARAIYELLRVNKEGMYSADITEALKAAGTVPAHWTRQHTSNRLWSLQEAKFITKWPGNLWKIGPKVMGPTAKVSLGRKADVGAVGKPPKKDAVLPTIIRKDDLRSASRADIVSRAAEAIDRLRLALDSLDNLLAEIDTSEVKSKQREQAIEAARKLLQQAGI